MSDRTASHHKGGRSVAPASDALSPSQSHSLSIDVATGDIDATGHGVDGVRLRSIGRKLHDHRRGLANARGLDDHRLPFIGRAAHAEGRPTRDKRARDAATLAPMPRARAQRRAGAGASAAQMPS